MATTEQLPPSPGLPSSDEQHERDFARKLAERYRLSFIDLKEQRIDPELFRTIPADLMFRYNFVPLEVQNNVLSIAVADPSAFLSKPPKLSPSKPPRKRKRAKKRFRETGSRATVPPARWSALLKRLFLPRSNAAPVTSTSKRAIPKSPSSTALTEFCNTPCSLFPRNGIPRYSRASKCSATWISPSAAFLRTAASASNTRDATLTCAFPSCPRAMARTPFSASSTRKRFRRNSTA